MLKYEISFLIGKTVHCSGEAFETNESVFCLFVLIQVIAVKPWEDYLTSRSFSFLICKMLLSSSNFAAMQNKEIKSVQRPQKGKFYYPPLPKWADSTLHMITFFFFLNDQLWIELYPHQIHMLKP